MWPLAPIYRFKTLLNLILTNRQVHKEASSTMLKEYLPSIKCDFDYDCKLWDFNALCRRNNLKNVEIQIVLRGWESLVRHSSFPPCLRVERRRRWKKYMMARFAGVKDYEKQGDGWRMEQVTEGRITTYAFSLPQTEVRIITLTSTRRYHEDQEPHECDWVKVVAGPIRDLVWPSVDMAAARAEYKKDMKDRACWTLKCYCQNALNTSGWVVRAYEARSTREDFLKRLHWR